jgi:nucleotide-binding universal stress UspA family protein
MDRIRSIVVGVDFTPCSKSALRQALRIADWNRGKLVAVHALDPLLAAELELVLQESPLTSSPTLVDGVTEEWEEFTADVRGAAQTPFFVDVDNPLASMIKRVDLHNADLLVLGAHGQSSSATTGALASACVRRARSKVLLVREDQPHAYKNVVVCVDFSDTSRLALSQGVRVALQDEAFLHLIHVFEMPWKSLRRGPQPTPEVESRYRHALPVRLRDFAAPHASEMGYLEPEYTVIENPSHGDAIAQYVKDLASPLVVLGTRGHTSMHDLLVGSTAERVVAAAPCSILAIRPV